ncbi:semaphorin-1A-like [Diadema setosum]|uniref:semaphorin-1A-like n=1 Tax=Diadema setosum TaxID=31175 RepID=UPI003B3A31AE
MAVFKSIIGGTVLCLFLMDSVQGKYNKATFPTAMDAFSTLSCSFSEIDNNTLGWNIYQILDVTSLYVLLGSRERVYVLNADDMTVKNNVSLELENSVDYDACELVNSANTEYICQNYISFGYFENSTAYRVCGTYNSESPRCYDCSVEGYCNNGSPVDNMPRRPQQNFSSTGPIDVGGSEFYFIGGLVNHYSEDPLFSKVNVESGTEAVKTDEIESQWLEEPVDFVGEPMDYGGHIYFVYREKAEEYSNIGNVIYSRIGRVCKNDTGGIAAPLNGNFLTFLKARLTCSVGSEFPFYFDIVQDTVRDGDYYFYGMFTTTSGGTPSTAICRYDLREIEDLFNEDNRRGQESSDKLWLEVTRHSDDTEARRTCAQAYELGSNSIYSHLEKYPLLNTNVVSCGFGQTCTYPRGLDESVTDALAVLEGVKGQEFAIYKSSEISITVFIGTNNAKILNVSISADSAEVLEEISIERRTFNGTYLEQRWPYGVRDITIEKDRVYATMDECAVNFGVGDSLPPLPSTIKDRTDMYDKKNCTHRSLPSSVTNCFLLFEGEEGTEIEAEFDTDLHAGTYNVNSKRFNTAQGCREFLHVHIIIRDDMQSLKCPDGTPCTYPGNVTVSSASGKTSPIVVPFDIDVDSSEEEMSCNRTAVMEYDYNMAVYRYEFKDWLRKHVTCENAEMNVCPSPQACNGDV